MAYSTTAMVQNPDERMCQSVTCYIVSLSSPSLTLCYHALQKTRGLDADFHDPRGANGDAEAESQRLMRLRAQRVVEQEADELLRASSELRASQQLRSLDELHQASTSASQDSRLVAHPPQTALGDLLHQSEGVKWMLVAMVCLIVALVANQAHLLPGSDGVSGGISSLLLLLLLKGTSSTSGQ